MILRIPNAKESAREIGQLSIELYTPSDSDDDPEKLSPAVYAGKTLVLFVLGTNCENCKQIMKSFSGLLDEYAASVVCAGVCVQPGCRYKLGDFAEQTGCRIPLGYCSTRSLCVAIGISVSTWLMYPTLIFIDQNRLMRGYVTAGDEFFENTAANCRAVLDRISSESSVTAEAA